MRDMGRVLVTGAQGFLGAALIVRLQSQGHQVTGSDLGTCDLTEFAQVSALVQGGYQTIFHCGAVSGPMVMADQPLQIWRINALGTAHVLEAARLHGVARVVICSTSEVYGAEMRSVDEASPPNPRSIYAASKLAAEHAMLGYVREHGLDAVALRLSWVYGPGRLTPTTLENILRKVRAGEAARFDAGAVEMTHYLYIDDAVTGLLCAGQCIDLPGRVYNITAGDGVPLQQVAATIMGLRQGAQVTVGDGRAQGPAAIGYQRAADHLGFHPVMTLQAGLAAYLQALAG